MSSVNGLGSLLAKIEAVGGNAEKSLKKSIGQATKNVQKDVKLLTPVRDGDLRDSIKEEVTDDNNKIVGRVYTNLEYAPYVEFGTGKRGDESPSPPKWDGDLSYREDWAGMPAQPYLYPAATNNEKATVSIVKKKLREDLRKLRK